MEEEKQHAIEFAMAGATLLNIRSDNIPLNTTAGAFPKSFSHFLRLLCSCSAKGRKQNQIAGGGFSCTAAISPT